MIITIMIIAAAYVLVLWAAAELVFSKLENIDSIGKLHPITTYCVIAGLLVLAPIIFVYMICNSFYVTYIKN
jgi:hypothetical protein